MPDDPVRVAVLGAGVIGRAHIQRVRAEPCAQLAAIVDPADAAQALAAEADVPWFPDVAAMLHRMRPEGAIVATPNGLHVAHGLALIEAGVPALVEKPLSDRVADATRLVEAAERAGVPLMTGHHRRHNPIVQAAKAAIDAGQLGEVIAVQGTCWFYKPPAYFEVPWRREAGAGPVFLNLIHDVDLLRHWCGDVVAVQAMESNAQRGHAVEETAVILLRFASGVLGTVTVSDTVVSPWSWEGTSGENPAYMRTEEACFQIGGTCGSLSVPFLDLWRNPGAPSWMEPIGRERLPVMEQDPLVLQIQNLCAVVRGTAAPVMTGRDGLETLRVIAAVKEAARTGRMVSVG